MDLIQLKWKQWSRKDWSKSYCCSWAVARAMGSPKLFSSLSEGRRMDVPGYLPCQCHSGEKDKCDVRKFRSEKELRMRHMDTCNRRKWLVLRDFSLCKVKWLEKLFRGRSMTSWHFGFCNLFTEMSIYRHSFSLNIITMQSSSPRLLLQSTSPSSRQLEKNGL